MSKYRVILDTVLGEIYVGTKSECELVLKAFKAYNGGKNIVMEEVEQSKLMTDEQREEVKGYLADYYKDGMFGDGMEDDYVYDGCVIEGLNDYDDERLIEEYENMVGEDGDELIREIKANIAIDKTLGGE
jgi:hypothetical protein